MGTVPRIISESRLKLPQFDLQFRDASLFWTRNIDCKTLVGGSLMFEEDAKMEDLGYAVSAGYLSFKDTAIIAFSYLIYS
jgi:hypothetical protein